MASASDDAESTLAMLRTLDPLSRRAITLVYLRGTSVAQAASEMGTTVQRLNATLMAAMRKVAEGIEKGASRAVAGP